ncbi:winged helix DNA-binding protein [Sphingomonas sp. 28-63-12]|uniref:winged helix DNA-binding protein n=1 Tax=Sphingomonas sp. 28-63-12 TaxID=1970434 RepID=UPI000BD05876|nr:MAG: hypothetical protein B7Y47_13310 [Sphingomonas sp. 28-63-12]
MSIELRNIQGTLAEIDELEAVLAYARSRVLSFEKPQDLAAEVYQARRVRDACFGDDAALFGEPAWDILLDLYSAGAAGREMSISTACSAANVPSTTALRHLGNLEERGLIERQADPEDRRRSIVKLSSKASAIMTEWLVRHDR